MSDEMKINIRNVSLIIGVLATLGTGIATAARHTLKQEHLERRQDVTEVRVEEDQRDLSEIKGDLKVIKDQIGRVLKKLEQ
jgi:hypothetical protein